MSLEASARLALYVQNDFGKGNSKTAEGILRYGRNEVVAVIDQSNLGKTIISVVGIDHGAPIVSSIEAAKNLGADTLVLGLAFSGGHMPEEWHKDILDAVRAKMDIVNGLHDFLSDDEEIAQAAKENGRQLFDVRRPPENLPIGSAKALGLSAKIILTVGTDASIGKMTTSLEIERVAKAQGYKTKFIATGQTGIMICGEGICIDRVIGDFMAGAVEKMLLETSPDLDYIFVEGQGGIAHPGFSGVTLGLLHGACPQGMVLCHQLSRRNMKRLPFPLPSIKQCIATYENLAGLLTPSKVLAISVDSRGFDEVEARQQIAAIEKETGLPCNDPVRFDAKNLFQAIEKHMGDVRQPVAEGAEAR
jgi:uncharacterized NAD-dependent epimerase/dehydratase family protein